MPKWFERLTAVRPMPDSSAVSMQALIALTDATWPRPFAASRRETVGARLWKDISARGFIIPLSKRSTK